MIVIKRPKRVGGAHHGGAWKIAYADFVTAMMAFFLLLWLLASTTEEQREGISNFFNAIPTGGEGGNGVLQGTVIDTKDIMDARDPSGAELAVFTPAPGFGITVDDPDDGRDPEQEAAAEREAEEAVKLQDEKAFAGVEHALKEALQKQPELGPNLVMDRTPDGLRIQIIDQERSPMFASGSAVLAPRMEQLLRLVGTLVAGMPNNVAVAGHTDANPFSRIDYGNWELSADRANAARRILANAGVPERRFVRVQGLADRQPLNSNDPLAPSNRRISVLLMSGTAPTATN